MTVYDITAQLVGFVGFIAVFASFQMKSRSHILLLQLIGGLFFAFHFGLLGAFTGAVLNIISVVKVLLFRHYSGPHRPAWPPHLIAVLLIGATAFTWSGWVSLLPMIGMLALNYGFWRHNEQTMRRSAAIASPVWLVYNVINFSIAGIITELFVISSIAIALWRFRH